MKKILIFLLFFTTSLSAEKVERLGFYNIQELLEDDNLTYKIIKSCVSLNSAITEIISFTQVGQCNTPGFFSTNHGQELTGLVIGKMASSTTNSFFQRVGVWPVH